MDTADVTVSVVGGRLTASCRPCGETFYTGDALNLDDLVSDAEDTEHDCEDDEEDDE